MCAKSAQLRARADQKCVKPGFILQEKISEVGIGSKRATLGTRQIRRAKEWLKHSVNKVCVPNLHIAHF